MVQCKDLPVAERQALADRARELVEGGMTLAGAARELGLLRATVWKWSGWGWRVGANGRPRGPAPARIPRHRGLTDAARAEMRELKEAGVYWRELAERFGCSPRNVFAICEPPAARRKRLRRRCRKLRLATIRRLWSAGWTGTMLGKRYGLAKSTISGIVRVCGSHRHGPSPEQRAWPFPRRKFLAPRRLAFALAVKPSGPADRILGTPQPRGSAHGRAKLGEAQVIEARRLRSEGVPFPELSRRFGVPVNTLCYAVNGTTWGHLPGAIPSEKGGRR